MSESFRAPSTTPFWSDDFDMDLPKVIPDSANIVGALSERTLYTVGREDRRLGNLNHPAVWNGYEAMMAYFGSRPNEASFVPPGCVHPGDTLIKCSVWEAVRDAWAHSYRMHVDGQAIWDTFALNGRFERLMWLLRGWCDPDEKERARHTSEVNRSLRAAMLRLRGVLDA